MASDSYSGRLYERVSRDIASRIERGDYPVGARLPAERQLAVNYDVSRPTVREAIIALEVDGLVEVRKGSGVYVVSSSPHDGAQATGDVGPFELLEARREVEGQVAALAAARITDADLCELRRLIEAMRDAGSDATLAEVADRDFHLCIARTSLNSALVATIELFWEMRARSPQYRLLSEKAHFAGVIPSIAEHEAIVAALASHNAEDSRAAMRKHLSRVLQALLEATEVRELELVRQRVAIERHRYTA